MARTPLMDVVLRSLRAIRASAATGIPADEWAATRREALRAAAGTAGAALLGGCAAAPPVEEGPAYARGGTKVVVVGGGIAGLHCARRLRALGVAAEVREASSRTGGRMFSDRHTFGPQSCELGGERIDTGHGTMLDLAAELGLELLDYTTDDPALAPWVAHFGGRRLTEKEILEGLAPVAARVEAALAAGADRAAVDRQSIREWLDGTGLAGPVRSFVDVAYVSEYGLETDDSSALNFVDMISTDRERLSIFGDSDERFRFRAGNEAVVERMASDLDPGQVRLASRLVRVRRVPDGRLRLTFDRGAILGSEEVLADHAVLALPFTLLREVELDVDLPPAKRRAIAELGYGTNAKIVAGFKERAWRKAGSNGEVFTDLGFQCAWEATRLQPGRGGILTNFTGGRHGLEAGAGSAGARAQEFVDGLGRVFPGAGDAHDRRAVRMHWPTQPWTKGSYSSYRVGQVTAFGGAEFPAVGNLHFCGEHTSADAQGFMEGAALTGAMAALGVAADLGIAVPPGNPILDRARSASMRAYGASQVSSRNS
jgi:monoamine oxidase